ncbi:hypothetical protein DFH07DRAFT_1021319 [Mycena maculata]|uniref:Uncharacterized protein n=1 Tax=Mycena maculata TaxID=230809 RepID=A0AAD7JAY6_9AGAR|nr:hypothetical protein DFH07DRAFT_1021319 [Mycena maculata]
MSRHSCLLRNIVAKDVYHEKAAAFARQGTRSGPNTPLYKWDEGFNIPDFKRQIAYFNARLMDNWLSEAHSSATEEFCKAHGIPDDSDIFEHAVWLTHANNVPAILSRASDIIMPVVPHNLVAYMNQLVGKAQEAVGLKVQPILMPAVEDSRDSNDGLYVWRIGKETMWQQLDRRIDEVSEVLYAFYRVNDRIYGRWKDMRLITQLSERAIQSTVEDEFDVFARWIGRQPIFVDRFFNSSVQIENMEGQEDQYTTKYSMGDSE